MKWIIHATAMTLIAVGSLPTASAQTLTVTVDCDRGQTITDALRQGDAASRWSWSFAARVTSTCRSAATT